MASRFYKLMYSDRVTHRASTIEVSDKGVVVASLTPLSFMIGWDFAKVRQRARDNDYEILEQLAGKRSKYYTTKPMTLDERRALRKARNDR